MELMRVAVAQSYHRDGVLNALKFFESCEPWEAVQYAEEFLKLAKQREAEHYEDPLCGEGWMRGD